MIRLLSSSVDDEVIRETSLRSPFVIAGAGVFVAFLGAVGSVIAGVVNQLGKASESFRLLLIPSAIVAGVGFVLFFVGVTAFRLLVRARSELNANATLERSEYRDDARLRVQRERDEEAVFRRNLLRPFVLHSLAATDVHYFEDFLWQFAPRVNVVLGRNGYGKTLLLRTLVAMIQSNQEHSQLLLQADAAASEVDAVRVRLVVTRDGVLEETSRDDVYFAKTVGRLPVLAIPDSRFINRRLRTISPSPLGTEPLTRTGARHFLTQEPFEDVVQQLLYRIGLDYHERPSTFGARGFNRPLFKIIVDVIRTLTEDDQFAFDDIRRVGDTGFEILVRTGGNEHRPLRIQQASQGTLSVLAIVGLVFSFLDSLAKLKDSSDVTMQSAVVIVDELDAHLHPAWQQKILGILTSHFPNVQFIVSAHSPLVIAGCDQGEVSVLRRNAKTDRFTFSTMERDFLGVRASELYEAVFDIEDVDRLYLEYATKGVVSDPEEWKRLERRNETTTLGPKEASRLEQLRKESRLVSRARDERKRRLDEVDQEALLDRLKRENEDLKRALRSASASGERNDTA